MADNNVSVGWQKLMAVSKKWQITMYYELGGKNWRLFSKNDI
jgi:hypothetical protein